MYLSTVFAPVGAEDPHKIPEAQINASSYYLSYYPHMGRLNGVNGWCQKTIAITDDYIQVKTGALHTVCAIATQMGHSSKATSFLSLMMKAAGVYIRNKTLTRFEIILL